MLEPKYVHGVNADEAPRSVLNRLRMVARRFIRG